ncbi:class I SAM-dependent methyltransferase [Flagellimonas zhangzhouensis]|uniref:Methyltransferase domain-containing protein n=1 Tax=Flagellimonas zhangzhouensis TaxID=1073328 RepID=A0A1H2R6R4_9FLAO|nr:class I SAM-dependent methyltransferase [Allomuricauda zhangzhouensis]SDQ60319.1 Methyltransferase domain-containing protein [Allomuricauda zhangzhouensis]SDW15156.1 Methyltransferase domain-containing protein [Allomuricauda zhangzhouensis]
MSDAIKSSWNKNAEEWVKIIQNDGIPSRKFTNPAILEVIKELKGNTIVDIGCGEGWLTRELKKFGWKATGLDATEDLIKEARKQSDQTFEVFTFEDIIQGEKLPNAPFDAAIFNFCLYLKDGLLELLSNTLKQLTSNGSLVIQTLHPYFLLQNDLAYKSQWFSDSWKGLPGNFTDGHAWYARTMEDWIKELNKIEHFQFNIKEVLNDEEKPISLIIIIKKI